MLLLTGPYAIVDSCAVGGRAQWPRGPADSAEAEGVQSPWEHPSQNAAARGAAVVGVDDRQPVLRSPLEVKVIVV